MKKLTVLLAFFMLASTAAAIDTGKAFDDPELQARYDKLISEVRCLKCQNNSIKDSNVFLAADLRREIRRLISEGKSNAEIEDFLVERYGEFALYRPRTSGKTLLLWIAPFMFVVLGGIALVRVVRHRMTLPLDPGDDGSEDESRR
jgi:cytochrome c-type biogenesis protein CcmH